MKIYWNQESNSKNLIGQRVKALRIEKHMSQKALAEQLQLAGYDLHWPYGVLYFQEKALLKMNEEPFLPSHITLL